MAKVVDPEIVDVGFGAERPKSLLNGAERLRVVPWRGKHPWRSRAVFRAPSGHGFESLKRRRIQRNDAVLFGFSVFAFEGDETLLGADTLQSELEQFVPAATGVQSQLNERWQMRPYRHRLCDRDHALRFAPRDPSSPALWYWEGHADEGIGEVELVQEAVPVDRGAKIVQFAVDSGRAHAGGLSQGDVPLNGRPSQAAKRASLEKAVQLELAVPETLSVFARSLVGLHHRVIGGVFVGSGVFMNAMPGIAHAIDRRAGGGQGPGGVLSWCESMVHVSGRPLRPESVRVGGHQRPTFANIWQMMITY